LSYFDDGNLRQLSEGVKNRLLEAAREVDLNELHTILPLHDNGRAEGKSR
jgi:hypothetical protein